VTASTRCCWDAAELASWLWTFRKRCWASLWTARAVAYRQQKGFVHGGIIGMIADTACGYAAYSLMPADSSLVTVEYKINILAPARGSLVARGEVIRPGRTLTVTRGEVYADDGKHIASMQQTLMMLANTPDTPE